MRLATEKPKFDITVLSVALCCFTTCITGQEGVDTILVIGRYLLLGLMIISLFRNQFRIRTEVMFFCFANVCAAVITAVYHTYKGSSHFLLNASLNAVLWYCIFILIGYYIAQDQWNTGSLFQWIHWISLAAGVIVILQHICYLQGIRLHQLPLIGEYVFHAVDSSKYYRPSAFFSEPSHLSEFVLLDLFNNLFRKKNIWFAGMNMLVLALSTSSLGIVFGLALFAWWVISRRISKNRSMNAFIKIVVVVLLVAIILFIFNYTGNNTILQRISNGATIVQRTLRAFEIYSKLKPGEQIFGIGMQNLTSYLNNYYMYIANDVAETQESKEFAQSFGYMLCTLGILGGGLYLLNIVSLLKKTGKKYCGIVLLFAALSITCNLITRTVFVMYIAAMWTVAFERENELSQANQLPVITRAQSED